MTAPTTDRPSTPEAIRDAALAARDAYIAQAERNAAEEVARRDRDRRGRMAQFNRDTGIDHDWVAGPLMIDGLTFAFRDDWESGAHLVVDYGPCPECGRDRHSHPLAGLINIGYALTTPPAPRWHDCPVVKERTRAELAAQPQTTLDRLRDVLRELMRDD